MEKRALVAVFAVVLLAACATDGQPRLSHREEQEKRHAEVGAFVSPLLRAGMHEVREAFVERAHDSRICDQGHAIATKLTCIFYYGAGTDGGRGHHPHDKILLMFNAQGQLIDWELRN